MSYFTIRNSDGDTRVDEWTKEELEERLEEGYWGKVTHPDKLPENSDTNYWGNSVLIIRGEVVSPKAVKTVIKLELP